jgi:Lipoprotein LpqB beta-propeller domain/Sporulation and spore germination
VADAADVRGRRLRAVGLPALAAVALALAACTAVPDSGPIHAGQQPAPGAAQNIRVNPRAPVAGLSPDNIVTGFRFANSDTTEALGVAKAYLVDGASWQPIGANVVSDSGTTLTDVQTGPNTVTVKVVDNQIGQIAADGTYQPSPSGRPLKYDYNLVKDPKENDQWRITNAPANLVLTVAQIQSSYQEAYVYFLRPDEQMLVPVQVFLPVSRDQLAQELLTTLLGGPPAWLKPAVTTALLGGTAPGPTQINGVTTVDLPRGAATLPAAQRNAMAAQITYTLSNVATPSQNFGELKILTGGQPLINTQALALQTAANWASFDPDGLNVNFYYSDSSHQTRDHLGRLIAGDTGELDITPLLAPAVAPRASAAAANQLIAGVVQDDDGTESLYAGPLLAPKKLLSGSNFTTPSWDSLGNLWTVQQQQSSSAPRVRIAPSGKAALTGSVAVPPILAKSVIEELKVSRDGTRIAVLAVSTNVSQVMVGAVAKDGTSIVNFYPVAPALTSVTDFVWASSTKLDILDTVPNTNEPGNTSQLWTVDVDGWAPSLTQGTVLTNAVSIAAAPRQPLVVATSLNQVEQYSNGQWQFIGNGSAPHYPG